MGIDREVEQMQSVPEVVLPDRFVPFLEILAAPNVVDQNVQLAGLHPDATDQPLDLVRDQVVDPHGDRLSSRRRHQLTGLLDRLRAPVLGRVSSRTAAGHVDGGAGGA